MARNTLWTLGGSVGASAIALFSVPILLRHLGTDRLGVIALAWMVEGQFGVFDLGLSQALTKLVAEKLGLSREEDIPAIFWSALLIMAIFGLMGAILLRVGTPWLVYNILKVPIGLRPETILTFHLIAISLPIVISSAGLKGFLAAHQRFDLLTTARLPISIFSYLAPLAALPFSSKLGPVILILVASRFIGWTVHMVLCLRIAPILRQRITIKGAPFAHMFHFGGWMTVTNIVSPIMANMDRLLIGALISMSAVAYYATPFEVVNKLVIIPGAIAGVLFPALSVAIVRDRERASLLFDKGVKYIFLALFPIILVLLALGRLGLQIWLGSDFAQKSTSILQLLAIGVFANSLAQVPFCQIQAANRPDLAARVHLAELPCCLLGFWFLTSRYGITGAGVAWSLRTTIDAAIMFWLSGRLLPESKPSTQRLLWMAVAVLPLFVVAVVIRSTPVAIAFLCFVAAAYLVLTWFGFLTVEERAFLGNSVRSLTGFSAARAQL